MESITNIYRMIRVRAKRLMMIAFLSLFLAPYSILYSQPTTEQQQQFTYYWYAAKQAIEQDRYADALALLEFCRLIQPDDGQTLSFLGIIYNGLGQTQRAIDTFRQAFEADPHDQWFRYYTALMETKTEEGTKEALRVLEKAYKVNPTDEDLMEQLKRLYIAGAQWKKALAMQNKIDKRKGYDGYSAITRYRIYAMWGKPRQAVAEVDRYLETDPTDLRFLLFRVELMETLEKAKAVKIKELYNAYEQVLILDPNNPMVLNNYAYHLATHGGDLKKAEQMSAITIQEDPNSPVYLDTYGWIMHLQGQEELALFYLNRALWHAKEETKAEIEHHLMQIKEEK